MQDAPVMGLTLQLFEITSSIVLSLGYPGIFYLMTLDSLMVPLGSEAILSLAGYLAYEGKMNLLLIIMVGVGASVLGSVLSWLIGRYGGRKLLLRYGSYFLIGRREIERGDEFFRRHGDGAVMGGRIIPLIRTYVSLPAGIAEMEIKRFILYTLAGSVAFCLIFSLAGYELGPHVFSFLRSASLITDAVAALILIVIIFAAVKYFTGRRMQENQ